MTKQYKHPPLTKEQQALIEDYLSDGYKQCKGAIGEVVKRKLSSEEWEDFIGAAHLGIAKAARNYHFGEGTTFSTFASMNIKSSVMDFLSYENRSCRKEESPSLRLDGSMSESNNELSEIIGEIDEAINKDMEDKDFLKGLFKLMNPFEQEVTKLLMYNYTVPEICRILNCTSKHVEAVKTCTYQRVDIISEVRNYIEEDKHYEL